MPREFADASQWTTARTAPSPRAKPASWPRASCAWTVNSAQWTWSASWTCTAASLRAALPTAQAKNGKKDKCYSPGTTSCSYRRKRERRDGKDLGVHGGGTGALGSRGLAKTCKAFPPNAKLRALGHCG